MAVLLRVFFFLVFLTFVLPLFSSFFCRYRRDCRLEDKTSSIFVYLAGAFCFFFSSFAKPSRLSGRCSRAAAFSLLSSFLANCTNIPPLKSNTGPDKPAPQCLPLDFIQLQSAWRSFYYTIFYYLFFLWLFYFALLSTLILKASPLELESWKLYKIPPFWSFHLLFLSFVYLSAFCLLLFYIFLLEFYRLLHSTYSALQRLDGSSIVFCLLAASFLPYDRRTGTPGVLR